ncbi:SMC domain-containing protein [Pseudomonas syringae pv. actinidiae ICMP 18807]|uniref:SMC domain-containing protein n=1 Tax=Pseudomonas syringae pv. actinidiae ICMP 18807 TaxID=1194404 RepID=S6V8G7_PSESF|nr:SMC domain-containing protein [Pseudomonas syringae pv. actinidiae ICMP 18807]
MKLQTLRLSSFQSYDPGPTDVGLEAITYLIGPNGSGKTAALQALCRLFAFEYPRHKPHLAKNEDWV